MAINIFHKPQMPKQVENCEIMNQIFHKVWKKEDKIEILKGMVTSVSNRRSDPASSDLDEFHRQIEQNLNIEVTKQQLQTKMTRWKKKFVNNRRKEMANAKDLRFKNPHAREAYDLSKKIWNHEGKILLAPGDDEPSMELEIMEIEAYASQLEVELARARLVSEELVIMEIEDYITQLDVKRAKLIQDLDHLKSS